MSTRLAFMNGVMMEYFESDISYDEHLWRKVARFAPKLKKLGIDALWLPPAFKGANGIHDVGYGVYDLYDLGEFNQRWTIPTKYGTKDEYLNAIACLHREGIQVYPDIVLNHRMGSDNVNVVEAVPVSYHNRLEVIGKPRKILAATQFNYYKRFDKYSSFKWTADHFNGVDFDVKTRKFQLYRFKDKEWSNYVSFENGNYDYLMGANVDVNQKDVKEELIRFGKWYSGFTSCDGFRLDALKHIDYMFYKEWLKEVRKGKELFIVGEYFDGRVEVLEDYLDKMDGALSLFDFPLHYRFFECGKDKENFDLRRLFASTLVERRGGHAVTFVDNHDTCPNQGLASFVAKWFKPMAYASILLRKDGYPCVFYGDYYGLNKGRYQGIPMVLETILRLRKKYATGWQNDYFVSKDCIGWTRFGGLAVIFSKLAKGDIWMDVGKDYANCLFYDVFRPTHKVRINQDGWGHFDASKDKLAIYIPFE